MGKPRWIAGLVASASAALLVACSPSPSKPLFTEETRVPDAPVTLSGIGDPYFPTYGNSGYDVQTYKLDVKYVPETDVMTGTTTIAAQATEQLTRFHLDLHGMTVDKVSVNDEAAEFSRSGDELM